MTEIHLPSSWSAGRASLAAAVCCGLAISGGCTRTSDGTIEPIVAMPSYSLVPSGGWWGRADRQSEAQAEQFPSAPAGPVATQRSRPGRSISRVKPKVPRFTVATKPLFRSAAAQPAKALVCRNVQTGAGKVRVVCN